MRAAALARGCRRTGALACFPFLAGAFTGYVTGGGPPIVVKRGARASPMYSKTNLKNVVSETLGDRGCFIVVSNREPFIHEHREGRIVCTQPAGGMTSALNPLLQ